MLASEYGSRAVESSHPSSTSTHVIRAFMIRGGAKDYLPISVIKTKRLWNQNGGRPHLMGGVTH